MTRSPTLRLFHQSAFFRRGQVCRGRSTGPPEGVSERAAATEVLYGRLSYEKENEECLVEMERAPEARGLEWDVEPDVEEYEGGRKAIDAFLAADPRPDAVQAYTDVMAAGFMASLHDHGLSVPQDVAVVGFDNRRLAELCWPPLTTVSQRNADVGETAAEIVLRRLRGEPPPPEGWSRLLSARVVVRESV